MKKNILTLTVKVGIRIFFLIKGDYSNSTLETLTSVVSGVPSLYWINRIE